MDNLNRETLFFENIKLVPFCYGKYYSDLKYLREDFIQAGYLGLWNACIDFDEKRGKFGTFAMKCIRHQMGILLQNEKKHWNECNYNVMQDNGNITNVLDIEDNGEFDSEISQIETDNVISQLKHKNEFNAYFNGKSLSDISKEFGITKGNANVRICRCKNKLRKFYGERKNSL